jgi:hypothetical protein
MRYVIMTIALALMLAAAPLGAEESTGDDSGWDRPADAPQRFDEIGRFQGFAGNRGHVKIDALKFAVSAGTRAYDLEGETIYLGSVPEDSVVGLITEPAGDQEAGRVLELWIMPENARQQH